MQCDPQKVAKWRAFLKSRGCNDEFCKMNKGDYIETFALNNDPKTMVLCEVNFGFGKNNCSAGATGNDFVIWDNLKKFGDDYQKAMDYAISLCPKGYTRLTN